MPPLLGAVRRTLAVLERADRSSWTVHRLPPRGEVSRLNLSHQKRGLSGQNQRNRLPGKGGGTATCAAYNVSPAAAPSARRLGGLRRRGEHRGGDERADEWQQPRRTWLISRIQVLAASAGALDVRVARGFDSGRLPALTVERPDHIVRACRPALGKSGSSRGFHRSTGGNDVKPMVRAASATGIFATTMGLLFGGTQVAASASFGRIAITGAVHEKRQLRKTSECDVGGSPLIVTLIGTVPLPLSSNFPEVRITQLKRGAPTHSVNLARTKEYSVDLWISRTAVWSSGWNSFVSTAPHHHFGSGTLSISPSGESGTLSTKMVNLGGPNTIKGTVHVKATWHCG